MTIAVIPVSGRIEIINFTIPRLLKQVDKVIIAGDKENEYISGTDFYICPSGMKLGAKWQFCVERAREYRPDYILVSSSGGVFADSFFDIPNCDVSGSSGLYYFDMQPEEKRMIYWPGYNGSRDGEPIGLGRVFSASFLDRCNWHIFEKRANSGIDFLTMEVIRQNKGDVILRDNQPLRISSYKYMQKDPFDRIAKLNNSVRIENINEILEKYGLDSSHLL